MATFEFEGKKFYIDGGLKNQLDKKIFPQLKKKDKDVVFGIDGKERSGKSKFGDILGAYASICLGRPYDLSNICMTPEEFRSKVQNSTKNDIVIYDEAHRGMGSRRALSEVNNLLIDLMMEMGQRNLFVVVILPTFFMLDRYVALFRLKGLFHIYEKKGDRGYWTYFNDRKKLKLYIDGKKLFNYNCVTWPKFKGRFLNQYAINEEEYRKKKSESFNDKPRITRAEVYIDQRDKCILALYNELGISNNKLATLLKKYKVPLLRTVVGEITTAKKRELGEITVGLAID